MEIIGAPFDLCGHTLGSRLGPAAVRLAGITETLTENFSGVQKPRCKREECRS
jgi:arginase family enzyme